MEQERGEEMHLPRFSLRHLAFCTTYPLKVGITVFFSTLMGAQILAVVKAQETTLASLRVQSSWSTGEPGACGGGIFLVNLRVLRWSTASADFLLHLVSKPRGTADLSTANCR